MLGSLNKVQIIGHLGNAPEVKPTPAGVAAATISVAVDRKFKSGEGEIREETEWFNVLVWDRLAQTCGRFLTKGSHVYVEGRLRTHAWEKDGQKYTRTEVVAERVIFLAGASSQEKTPRREGEEVPF